MQTALLEKIVLEPAYPATASVIWLHGLGSSGHDFEDVLPFLQLPDNHRIRFIFPHAEEMPIGLNGGLWMPAWYDIKDFNIMQRQDEEGIRQSEQNIMSLLDHELAQGIESQRIILMGFSQGGAMALHCATRYPKTLAGAACLSGYLLLHKLLSAEMHPNNSDLPIFMAHGLMDLMVPYFQGQQASNILESVGLNPVFNSYPMAHMVCMEEFYDLGAWIQQVLKDDSHSR